MRRSLLLIATLAMALGGLAVVVAGPAQAKPGGPGHTGAEQPRAARGGGGGGGAGGGDGGGGGNGVFLCYSKFQTVPGVWFQGQAAELLAAGYYYPAALKGNVEGGTNLGAFHLQCNATGTATNTFVNANGEVVGPEIAERTLGFYPLLAS